jgi:hypothetical protein
MNYQLKIKEVSWNGETSYKVYIKTGKSWKSASRQFNSYSEALEFADVHYPNADFVEC